MKNLHGRDMDGLILCVSIVVGIVVLITLIRLPSLVLSSRDGRKGRTIQVTILTARLLIILMTLGYAGNYMLDVRQRSHASTWHSAQSDMDRRYIARYAYLWNDKVLLRVYDTETNRLLAERTYYYLGAADLLWTDHSLIYDTSAEGSDGEIILPPSLYDRITAQLP